MAAKPKPGRDLADAAGRVALYARVSTEDQAERQTVQGQLGFLRQLAAVHQWPVASEYVDDGISGTVPLAQRPGGARLLADAAAGVFQTVVFYRLDRLGRKVEVLLDAHTALDAVGCVLKSGTEPFDTSNAIGRFVFQLLGSIAELERSTITERMTMGRDRVAKAGKWTGGPVPFGYDVDAGGCLQPSARLVPGIDRTEAAIAVEVFERLAAGTSATEEARRLQALGVPCERRYAGGKVYAPTGTWRPGRLAQMIHNPLYEGRHVLRSAHGAVERPVPALISAAVRAAACAQLERNRRLSKRNARDQYLLRGLITCECGRGFHGQPVHSTGKIVRYYRCSGQGGSVQPDRTRRCNAKR
jgi:site-specific DNA recombinase